MAKIRVEIIAHKSNGKTVQVPISSLMRSLIKGGTEQTQKQYRRLRT